MEKSWKISRSGDPTTSLGVSFIPILVILFLGIYPSSKQLSPTSRAIISGCFTIHNSCPLRTWWPRYKQEFELLLWELGTLSLVIRCSKSPPDCSLNLQSGGTCSITSKALQAHVVLLLRQPEATGCLSPTQVSFTYMKIRYSVSPRLKAHGFSVHFHQIYPMCSTIYAPSRYVNYHSFTYTCVFATPFPLSGTSYSVQSRTALAEQNKKAMVPGISGNGFLHPWVLLQNQSLSLAHPGRQPEHETLIKRRPLDAQLWEKILHVVAGQMPR